MSYQLDTLEEQVFAELGRRGMERLAQELHECGFYDTAQRARGFLAKSANPSDGNGLRVKHFKQIIRASRGQAKWLDDLIVYRAQVRAEFVELDEERERELNKMRSVRPPQKDWRTG